MQKVIEIAASWAGTPCEVKHLFHERDTFCVGEEPGCDFFVPAQMLGGRGKIVLADAGGLIFLDRGMFTVKASCEKKGPDSPKLLPGPDINVHELPKGVSLELRLGPAKFGVRWVSHRKRPRLPRSSNWPLHASVLFSLWAHVFFFLYCFLYPFPSSPWEDPHPTYTEILFCCFSPPRDAVPEHVPAPARSATKFSTLRNIANDDAWSELQNTLSLPSLEGYRSDPAFGFVTLAFPPRDASYVQEATAPELQARTR
jgi:hypothetical protein